MTIYYIKEELGEVLKDSQHDFDMWKQTKKESYLKDASNKLIAVAEDLASNKIKKDIKNWGEFKVAFAKEYAKPEILSDLRALHRFFYEDLEYDQTEKDIEYIYHRAKTFFRDLLAKETKKSVKV